MPHRDPHVKDTAGNIRRWLGDLQDFIDSHPRTGWYIAVVTTLNLIFTILQALG